jgi:two-component system phosphate regulon sensor histidine kinase PhoR
MYDVRRDESAGWSRPVLLIASLGAIGVLCLALLVREPMVVAGLSAAACLAIGLYLAAPRTRADARTRAPAQADGSALPAAARGILESLDEPLLVLDRGGRILFANRAAHGVAGADSERKHISSVLRTPAVLEAVSRVLGGGAAEDVEFTFHVPVERHYRAHVAGLQQVEPALQLVIVQFRDLTAMRRAEEMRADFVANASHELRTPLAAVTGFIDTLKGHARHDTDARERFLDIMSDEAARMRRLIDNLLSLTRIELNEHNPPAGDVDVVAVVRDAAAALAPLADADGVTIALERTEPLRAIGDRDELVQVFQNLLHNAIKYGRERGTVRVSFGRTGSEKRGAGELVSVAVADEGEGIPREAIPRLTERFYRVDVKRSRERGGTGLGLAIVKHILNRHRGRLQIESTPGSGSTFTVVLPAAAEA